MRLPSSAFGGKSAVKTEPEALSNNLVAGDSRLSKIAIGPSLAFTVPPHPQASPSAFVNEVYPSPLQRGSNGLYCLFGNLTPFFLKVDDG